MTKRLVYTLDAFILASFFASTDATQQLLRGARNARVQFEVTARGAVSPLNFNLAQLTALWSTLVEANSSASDPLCAHYAHQTTRPREARKYAECVMRNNDRREA